MSAKVVSSYVQRVWKFSVNIEPGSVPDMKPADWSSEIMRPTSVKITVETAPDRDRPVVSDVRIGGPKVLASGKMSTAIHKYSHSWSRRGPVPVWVDELTGEALLLADAEYTRNVRNP